MLHDNHHQHLNAGLHAEQLKWQMKGKVDQREASVIRQSKHQRLSKFFAENFQLPGNEGHQSFYSVFPPQTVSSCKVVTSTLVFPGIGTGALSSLRHQVSISRTSLITLSGITLASSGEIRVVSKVHTRSLGKRAQQMGKQMVEKVNKPPMGKPQPLPTCGVSCLYCVR